MKQKYIIPSIKVVKVQLQGLPLALSSVNVSSDNYEEGSMTDLVKRENPTPSSVWEDDWSKQ